MDMRQTNQRMIEKVDLHERNTYTLTHQKFRIK